MKYRKFGTCEWSPSVLGFGCCRFPVLGGDYTIIDEPQAIKMLRFAIEAGVNYLDTAYDYHGGNSERLVGKALRDGYRNRVMLTTKLPCWLVKDAGDFDTFLNEQLERLQTDHVDFYLLHRLNTMEQSWPAMRDMGVFDWAEMAIAEGRIGGLGFSFHDSIGVFKDIVDAYDHWAFCQIQYNYMDIDEQAGTVGLKYAASRGLPVVIMEPLLGGRLADPPTTVRKIWDSAPEKRTPVDWALRWLWNQPEVTVVLSGMSTLEQVEQNIVSACSSDIDKMDESGLALIDRVRAAYRKFRAVPCTQCRYCMPCPNGVDIPWVFSAYNRGLVHDDLGFMRMNYNTLPQRIRASECIGCHKCEERCSQRIPIADWMPRVHAVLGEGLPYPDA
ncbi:MAG: aldo/keto reductase [Candidatus Bathyarchaeia archaeon]|jgi:predicted aldo/keto reductase-like oxidoreductase